MELSKIYKTINFYPQKRMNPLNGHLHNISYLNFKLENLYTYQHSSISKLFTYQFSTKIN